MPKKVLWGLASLALASLSLVTLVLAVVADPSAVVSGIVVRLDGQPAAGAWVRVQATDNLVYASADGRFALVGLTEGVTVTITAWLPEHKVGWASVVPSAEDVRITVSPYDTRDNADYAWNTSYPDPANPTLGCGHCMLPPFEEWQRTAHAKAGTNARFFSIYNGTDISATGTISPGYKLDFPDTAGNCATCHAPGAAYDAPFTTDMNVISGVNQEGVFCEFCHKVGAVYLNPVTGRPYDNAPGVISLRLFRPYPGDQIFFGSLDDVTRRVSYLPLERQSQFCAPCHQFSFWGTPIYESFREWQESPYPAQGVECQTCHMPPGTSASFCLPEKGCLDRDPARLASHLDLGIKDEAFMQGTVAMTATATSFADRLQVTVSLANVGAGHHVPTDFPGRHLILTVMATDGQGRLLPLQHGSTVPEWGGALAGLPGKAFAKVLRDVKTGESPVISYWKQAVITSDNRIPAMASDVSSYAFAAPPTGGLVTITAELRFRRVFESVALAKGWPVDEIVMGELRLDLTTQPRLALWLPLVRRADNSGGAGDRDRRVHPN